MIAADGFGLGNKWLFNVPTHSFTLTEDANAGDTRKKLMDEAANTFYSFCANGWTCQ
jgi:hypothetical protein